MKKKTICLFFQVHQPMRLKRYHFFDIGKEHNYFDDFANRTITQRISYNSYLITNNLLLKLIEKYDGAFKVSMSVTGLALEQFAKYAPEVLDSFRELADTGCVEFLAQTYSHSLSSLVGENEFVEQVKKHNDATKKYLGVVSSSFNNTEMIYSDSIGEMVANMGYKTMLTECAKHVMGWKSPNFIYANSINPKLKLLLRNYNLSDDIAFRFSAKGWAGWPLTAEKYVNWIEDSSKEQDLVNIFMDYETFGEHQKADSGIFEFLESLPEVIFNSGNYEFSTVSETSAKHQPKAILQVPYTISWADEERDTSAWLGNELQTEAFEVLYKLGKEIEELNDDELNSDYDKLQASDHFYYMCTKLFADGEVHKYFTPYESPYEAYINYMNVLSDIAERIDIMKSDKK